MKYTRDEQNLIVMSSFGVTVGVKKLMPAMLKSFVNGDDESEQLLIKKGLGGVYNRIKASFFDPDYRKRTLEGLEERGIECTTLVTEDYPADLKQIEFPPLALFMKGRRGLLKNPLFGIVGSRHTAPNVLLQCEKFSKELSEHFTVVSGSAYGGDSAALEGAQGGAVSVLAYGFDYIDKSTNANLVKEVVKTGLIISEHYPTMPPRPYFFPARNRVLAGMCKGVLVISAGKKSGALITADYAAEYGRELFAFPYSLGISSGEGCNALIKKGAVLVQNSLDILQVFGLDLKPLPKVTLSADEQRAFSIIRRTGEVFVPAMADEMGLLPHQLIPILSSLEIKGLIARLGGNKYGVI